MKVNSQMIHIPPYISASWSQVNSLHLHTNGSDLVFIMKTGNRILVPNLSEEQLVMIFEAHMDYLNKEASSEESLQVQPLLQQAASSPMPSNGIPLLDIGQSNDLHILAQHNPLQANMPDLPQDVLQKIMMISQTIDINKLGEPPRPIPHCNCLHCQISRAINTAIRNNEIEIDEEITQEDLNFREWDISKTGERLFNVFHAESPEENFCVFLGTPVGCTCGNKHCEHIKAVLHSYL